MVVPTSTRTKRKRIGVTTSALRSRAPVDTGVMSPYPVVESVTVVQYSASIETCPSALSL